MKWLPDVKLPENNGKRIWHSVLLQNAMYFISGNHYRRPTRHLKAWYSTNQDKDRLYNFILGTHLYHFNMDSYFIHFHGQI